MEPGAIELRGPEGGAIAERNEEFNRRRMAQGRGGAVGGALRVTNPAALARLMSEMKAKAEQQRAAEQAREAERRQREGAAYCTPEQRAEVARAAREAAAAGQADGEDARVLEKRFDPARDYYQLLGLPRGAAATDVRRAYKKLALLYHPDKHQAEGEEQRAAIQDKFKQAGSCSDSPITVLPTREAVQVVEAFDVLSNEEQRRVYDKCRDYMDLNPGRGLPVLSPEEAALMRSGLAELSRLRRMGAKAAKHSPLERELFVSLEKLNSGCTKTVAVERRRVRPDGVTFLSTQNVHCILRRGSREGDRLVFEDDGEEAVDTLPGDLVLVLRQKPHPTFRRSGLKDLEVFCGSLPPGQLLFAAEVTTLHGKQRLLAGSAFREAAANGGAGGVWQAELPGLGLYDAAEPWEQPAGSLRVTLRYPAWLLEDAAVHTCLVPQPVHLLGSSTDVVAAALAAGSIAGMLLHRLEAAEMAQEGGGSARGGSGCSISSGSSWQDVCGSVASHGSGCGSGSSSRRASGGSHSGGVNRSSSSSSSSARRHGGCAGPSAVCLRVGSAGCSSWPAGCSPAGAAMLRVLQARVPGLRVRSMASSSLLDEEWLALGRADVIIVEVGAAAAADGGEPEASVAGYGAAPDSAAETAGEQHVRQLWWRAREAGLLELLWQRFWAGCLVAGVGQGCALLGRPADAAAASGGAGAPPILPWYLVRSGGGSEGWACLHAALAAAAPQADSPMVGVGIMASGCWLVQPWGGRADMLAAPRRDVLVTTAAWAALPANDLQQAGLQETEDADWGFFHELCPCP